MDQAIDGFCERILIMEADKQQQDAIRASHKHYSELCGQWETARLKSAELLDKYILAGAGGALVLSLTMLSVFGKNPVCPVLLLVSWILLALAAGCVLFNLHTTYRANAKEIERADRIIKEHKYDFTAKYNEDRDRDQKLNPWIDILNWIALFVLAVGVVCLLIFGVLNLSRYNAPSSSFSWSISYDRTK